MSSSTPALLAAPSRVSRRDGVATVALVVVCQLFQGLTFSGIPIFLPLIREDLHISFSQAGLISAAGTFSYAIGQVPAGYLADRFGPKRLFFVGLTAWSSLCVTLGLIHIYWLAVVNQLFAGAFRALLFAPGLSLLVSWFSPQRRATAMSLYMVGSFSGTILVSLVGPVIAHHVGWRPTFIGLAGLGIAAAFVYRAYAREKPRQEHAQLAGLREALALFRHRILWVCAGIQFFRFSVVTSFNVWLPSLLVVDRGFSLRAAGLVAAMSAAFSAPSNALGAYVSDRLKNPPLVIGGSLAILACMSTLLVTVKSIPLLLVVVAVSAIFLQFYFGPLFFVPVEILGQRTAGMTTGISNLFANLGGLLSAYALGVVRDEAGSFKWGFIGISVLCIAGIGLTVVLARMRARALADRGA